MILTNDQIFEVLKENPCESTIQRARSYARKLRANLYGSGSTDALSFIGGMENPEFYKLRVKYAKSNRDLFARLSRPIDKIFSAKGGSTHYNLSREDERRAMRYVSNLPDGGNVRDWVRHQWLPKYLSDPNGVIFLEIEQESKYRESVKKGVSAVYPTYISSSAIHSYGLTGNAVEWIIIEFSDRELQSIGVKTSGKAFRVVDDAFDLLVIWENQSIRVIKEHSYRNHFGYVPAILCSDIPHHQFGDLRKSFFDEVLDLAEQFLLKGSIKITHDFMHGFPKYWEYADDCNVCDGSGMKGGEDCEACGGKGKLPMLRVSDVKILRPPADKNDPVIAPDVAGYVEPSKTYWEIATADMKILEEVATATLWGSGAIKPDVKKTATEIMADLQPEADRLHGISEYAEIVHGFIVDGIIRIMINRNYPGSLISYGRRYLLEKPDELWKQYLNAKLQKAPVSALNALYDEFVDSECAADPMRAALKKKMARVEPFFHKTAAEVQSMGLDQVDLFAKLYYSDWINRQSNSKLLADTADELRKSLYEFASQKIGDPQNPPL